MSDMLPLPAHPFHEPSFHELRRLSRAHLWRGLALAAALHASLIVLTLARIADPEVVKNRPFFVIPSWQAVPPPLQTAYRVPEGGPASQQEVKPILPPNAVVEPVSMETADPDVTMATTPSDTGGAEGTGTGEWTGERLPEGSGTMWAGAVQEPLPDPDEYIPFEEPPELVSPLAPVYPRIAVEAGVEGMVSLLAFVGKDGLVKAIRVESGVPMLDDAAVAAVRNARFRPALQNKEPVGVWIRIPVRFRLRS